MLRDFTQPVTLSRIRIDAAGRRFGGFSLLEIMVVLILMGILAALVTLNVRGFMSRGKQNAARVEIRTICDAIEAFDSVNGRYPTNEEGLTILCQRSAHLSEPLLKQQPIDPWGHPYQYNCPGRNNEPYEVESLGADGREGGDGENTDIVSSQLKERRPAGASASNSL